MAASLPARRVVVRVRQAFLGSVPPEFAPLIDGALLSALGDRAQAAQRSPTRPRTGWTPPVAPVVSKTQSPRGTTSKPRSIRFLSDAVTNLSASFTVDVPPGVDPVKFAEALGTWEGAEAVYVAPEIGAPPMANGAGPDWFPSVGVPARRRPLGQRVSFVDLEWGFSEHEALPRIETVAGTSYNFWWHGNAVLGLLVGRKDGIVPRAKAMFASPWTADGQYDLVGAIAAAAQRLSAGDVLLIEVQARCGDQVGLPVEVDPAVQDLLAILRHAEIIVVEAAGNGGHPLDELCVIGRGPGTVGDSGALLVGAYNRDDSGRIPQSNHGSRVGLWARGEAVSTAWSNPLGAGTDLYTDGFDGTSAAAALVAGVVIAIQSRAKRRWCWFVPIAQPPLTPEGMEQRLFEHGRAVEDGRIPDLAASLQDLP